MLASLTLTLALLVAPAARGSCAHSSRLARGARTSTARVRPPAAKTPAADDGASLPTDGEAASATAAPPLTPPTSAEATSVSATPVDAATPTDTSILPRFPRIAIMPLSSLGSTDEAVQAIERVLHGELRKLIGGRLVTASEIGRSDAKIPAELERCEGVLDCLLEVCGAYGWRAFIVGNVTGLGDDRAINLKLVDIGAGKEIRHASQNASGDEGLLIKEMRKAAVTLLAPELLVGTLEIHAEQPGLQIVIDGQLAGTTPLARPLIPLGVGSHAIEASGKGLVTLSKMVDIEYDETVPLTISLPANAVFVGGNTPFRARWWPWVITAVGVAGVATGGYFYDQHIQAANTMSNLYRDGKINYTVGAEHDRWSNDLKLARIFGAAGGALILTTGTLFVIDLL
jgi:hypothetical protein